MMLCCFTVNCGKDPILEAAEALDDPIESGVTTPDKAPTSVAAPKSTDAQEPPVGVAGEPEPGIPEEPEPAPAGSNDRPEPPPHSSGDGKAAEPKPGIPAEPTPAPPGTPGGADHPGKEGGVTEDGPQVVLRGTVSGAEEVGGRIRIDLFDGDQRNTSGPRPRVIGVHEVADTGPFELSIAKSAKRVWIGAYRDLNQNNRPNKGEPFGWYSKNPVYLDDPPDQIKIFLAVEGKAAGLGLDFGE